MAIDYIIDQQCKVKENLSVDGMVSMIKQRNYAFTILDLIKKEGKTDEEARNSTFKTQAMASDGKMEIKEHKVSDLFDNTKPLDNLQKFCKDCPANREEAFGCYQVINYPISKKAEEWLIEISKNALEEGAPNSLTLNFILDQNITGDRFNQMRKDPNGVFFELRKPLKIVVSKGFLSKKVVNADQIFDILFGMGRMENPHMMLLSFFSGGLIVQDKEPKAGTFQQAFQITDNEGQKSWWVFNLEDKDTDDGSTFMLKEFFRSVFVAYSLHKDMIIDF